MRIPAKYIIEIGLLRKRNKCALCGSQIKNIPNHNIQLCLKCREVELKKAWGNSEDTFTGAEVEEIVSLSSELESELRKDTKRGNDDGR